MMEESKENRPEVKLPSADELLEAVQNEGLIVYRRDD
jgi:hypothetical protein